jgi:bifunctional enzyme CysN/CysC
MDNERLVEGRSYHLKIGTKTINATIMDIKYRIDIHTSDHIPAEYLEKNEIASVDIATTDRIVFEKFEDNEALGGFILIDKVSNMTSACGVVEHALRRSDNVSFEKMDVTKEIRAEKKGQKPIALWFTGLSSAGKSTLANALEKKLVSLGKHTMVLDGNNIRKGLNHDLGFDEPDRIENIRRVAEVVKLMNDAGLITISAFISPYESDRITAHEIIGEEFVEIYVSTPLEVCEARDVRGLYKKARNGEIPNFTGVSSPYEIPKNPDFVIDTSNSSVEDSISQIMKYLDQYL